MSTIYGDILTRCYNKNDKSYRFYGAKGITMCDEWLNNPASFQEWSLANGYTADLTIDRIDPAKGYSPDNCRWISLSENCKWKSTTNRITVDGVLKTGREWSTELGLGVNYINTMLREQGMEKTVAFIRDELACPKTSPRSIFVTVDGETKNLEDWAKTLGITMNALGKVHKNHDTDYVVEYLKKKMQSK